LLFFTRLCEFIVFPQRSANLDKSNIIKIRSSDLFVHPSQFLPEKILSMVEGYTWVPPGLSHNRVEEYMRQLPVEKVPKVGTVGERYRDRQLNLQLPKQDLSTKYCSHLEQKHQVAIKITN
jgi:hypothetical protein